MRIGDISPTSTAVSSPIDGRQEEKKVGGMPRMDVETTHDPTMDDSVPVTGEGDERSRDNEAVDVELGDNRERREK